MNTEYQEILVAARKAQDGLWELADALLKQFPILPQGNHSHRVDIVNSGLQRVSEYLAENKIYFTAGSLTRLRFTANKFPPHERISGLSVWTHLNSGSPTKLSENIALGNSLSKWNKWDKTKDGSKSIIHPKNISILLDRALDLASGCERISRGIKPSASLAKQAIAISEAFGRVAAMLSPTRKEYLEQK